jgi:catechol 2,3-dioxygenase-like lactoylglutathione lyase family enzyme
LPIPPDNPIKPPGLGEVVLRVADLQSSLRFYCDLLGFTLIRGPRFNCIRESAHRVEGHTQILGVFSKDRQPSREGQVWDGWHSKDTTLHHFAIASSVGEYHKVFDYLSENG